MDKFYHLVREAATTQAYNIYPGISDWFSPSDDVWRNILRKSASALNHHVATHAAELMGQNGGRNDCVIVHNYFAREFGGVSDYKIRAENTIVGHVHVFHKEVVTAHHSYAARCSASRNCDVLTDGIVVANLAGCVLAFEFKVLRFGRNACSGKDFVSATKTRTIVQCNAVLKNVLIADDSVSVDVAERADDVILAESCFGVYEG